MNFVRTSLTRDAGDRVATITGLDASFTVPATPALGAHVGRELIVGIRPEMFSVASTWTARNETIVVAEALGADTFVFFDIPSPPAGQGAMEEGDDFSHKGSNRLVARIPPALTPRPNQRLPLTIDVGQLHWFALASGLATRD